MLLSDEDWGIVHYRLPDMTICLLVHLCRCLNISPIGVLLLLQHQIGCFLLMQATLQLQDPLINRSQLSLTLLQCLSLQV